jgi:hypothetical protein
MIGSPEREPRTGWPGVGIRGTARECLTPGGEVNDPGAYHARRATSINRAPRDPVT